MWKCSTLVLFALVLHDFVTPNKMAPCIHMNIPFSFYLLLTKGLLHLVLKIQA
jgi:hypothetical protein